tara:strand:- start:581 stop:991 length:411 start_codon:yes stop_codon:yes gene_type:complete
MEKSCGVILFNGQKVLLLQHPDSDKAGHWDFPKGHVEDGENNSQTALRELAEETGIIDVELLSNFNHKISYKLTKGGKIVSKEVTFFVGITNQTIVSLSHEHQAYAWLNYESAINRLTYNTAKETLEASYDFYLKK